MLHTELPSEQIELEQKKVFATDVSSNGKIKYFHCPKETVWNTLLQGKGECWQNRLLTQDEFKVEQLGYSSSSRADKIYKSGNLLYHYCGGGKGSYLVNIYLLAREHGVVKLEHFFSIDCGRYELPSDLNLLPFNAIFDDGDATTVSSAIRKVASELKKKADDIASMIWNISIGKPIDPKHLTLAVNDFHKELIVAYAKVGIQLTEKVKIIKYNEDVLSKRVTALPEIKATPLKKFLFPMKFFKEGYDVEKRKEIEYLFNTFLSNVKSTDDVHIFLRKGYKDVLELVFATKLQKNIGNIIAIAKKSGVSFCEFMQYINDGHPTQSRVSVSCNEMDEDIQKLRIFLETLTVELNQNKSDLAPSFCHVS